MNKLISAQTTARALLPLILALPGAAARAEEPVLPEGGFEAVDAGGRPVGWDLSEPKTVTVVTDGKNRWVRIANTDPGKQARLFHNVRLDPGWAGVKLLVRMRVTGLKPGKENWQTARLGFGFFDEKGARVGGWPEVISLNSDSDWVVQEREYGIPPGAVMIQLEPGLFNATGIMEMDDLAVVPVLDPVPGFLAMWGNEPEEKPGPTRSRILLNGLWRWMPGHGLSAKEPRDEWGYYRVPGTWATVGWPWWNMPGPVKPGQGPAWEGLDLKMLERAWFEREFVVPSGWKDGTVLLALDRVSTDARIFIDGKRCGDLPWPGGELDVTGFVKPGGRHTLRILVVATADAPDAPSLLDAGRVPKNAELEGRGLIGDVALIRRPSGARLDGVFVKTSVRKREIAVDVDLADVGVQGKVLVTAVVKDASGKTVRKLGSSFQVGATSFQTVTLAAPWKDPKLWDFLRPNLYTVVVGAKGAGIDDELTDRFGFREFRISGKEFLLNEIPFRLRPETLWNEFAIAGVKECIAGNLDGIASQNFNILELWPEDHLKRGKVHFREMWAAAADEKGFPLIYPALSIDSYENNGKPDWEGWTRAMSAELKRVRNHPAILAWATSPNRYGHADDQNPLRIGNSRTLPDKPGTRENGHRIIAEIHRADPTRPATAHQGGEVGDFQATNNYLNMIPLQEREDWLSAWAKDGDKPYTAIEFGTPLSVTFQRGRTDYGKAKVTEPLMTEFCAIYLGSESYRLETPGYRSLVRERFIRDQEYQGMTPDPNYFEKHPAHLKVQALFDKNTWRSWRTWGITGGMVPWEAGHGWDGGTATVNLPPYVPGRAGTWASQVEKGTCLGYADGGRKPRENGIALVEGNSPVLAWIAGPPGAFTAKDHHFYPGEKIEKQIAVVNDERVELDYEVQLGVIVDGNRIARRTESGRISPGRSLLVPVSFKAPDVQNPADGVMIIWARIGTKATNDSFKFRVYPRPSVPTGATALIHDPAGDTKAYVEKLGWKTVPWDGQPAEGKLLVIGRKALSSGMVLPGSIAEFVASGGRAVIFGQDPEWLRKTVGLRVSRHVSRRFFPLAGNAGHPVVRGLDETDLADWRGAGTLVPETADTDLSVNRDWYPPFGWHWGNRGSVSGAAIEKPHHAGWRPLVDGEFDLAYSPLLETFVGKGMAVWCMLDVEGRTDSDPVADIITNRLLDYAATAVIRPRALRTLYLGDSRDRALLKGLGLVFKDTAPASPAPRGPGLLVVGSGARVTDSVLERFMADGGDVFFLARPAGRLPLGFKAESVTEFGGAPDIPGWEEFTGLSASDVRLRTNVAVDLLTGGPGSVVAQGILGRYRTDGGMALFFQLDPRRLDAGKNTYLRYSEWRVTRGLVQLLANLGAEFEMDRKGLDWGWRGEYEAIPLAGEWKYRIERRLDPAPDGKPWKDDGIAGAARDWARTGLDDSGWGSMKLPCEWEALGKDWKIDGAVWFRREITVPKTWAGKNLRLTIGAVDDFDVTYFNGVRIGATGLETPNFWATKRDYPVPASLVKPGGNVVAIRAFDHYGGGGIVGRPEEMALFRPDQPAVDYYVPGFRTDPVMGDDPYRYFRW